MNEKNILRALGNVDNQYIKEAEPTKKTVEKKMYWQKWVAMVACLCLVVVGTTVISQLYPNSHTMGEGGEGDLGGTNYSVAVYPASEKEDDVASADVVSLTENEALSNPLAEYLPTQLPDDFHYGCGSIYNTMMKDGTEYNMLRVEYISGEIPEQQFAEDGGAIAPDSGAMGDFFTVQVWNFEPDTEASITSVEEVTETLLEEEGSVYIRSGECYVGVFVETAEPTDVLETIKSITDDLLYREYQSGEHFFAGVVHIAESDVLSLVSNPVKIIVLYNDELFSEIDFINTDMTIEMPKDGNYCFLAASEENEIIDITSIVRGEAIIPEGNGVIPLN